jgi:hypothetical protein
MRDHCGMYQGGYVYAGAAGLVGHAPGQVVRSAKRNAVSFDLGSHHALLFIGAMIPRHQSIR